jgi:hypothetical protein
LYLAQDLAGIEMLGGGFGDAQNGATLLRDANAALAEVSLQAAWNLGFRQRHSVVSSGVATGRNNAATKSSGIP